MSVYAIVPPESYTTVNNRHRILRGVTFVAGHHVSHGVTQFQDGDR